MKNKIVVTIAGREYTMVAAEDENYVRKCAAHVDSQLRELSGARLSQTDAAVLCAIWKKGALSSLPAAPATPISPPIPLRPCARPRWAQR